LWAGANPAAYHATNIALHLAASGLLFALLGQLGCTRGWSLALALALAAHPALAPAVAWIPGRNDSLLAIFLFISMIALIRGRRSGKWPWYLLHFSALGCGLLTKETAAVFPLVLAAYLLLVAREKPLSRRVLVLLAAWAGVVLVWLALMRSALQPAGPWPSVGLNSAGDDLIGLLTYIGKVWLPFNLSALPVPRDMTVAWGAAAVALMAALFAGGIADIGTFLFGAVWFALLLLPMLARTAGSAIFLEHRLYLPLAGMMVMVSRSALLRRWSHRRAAPVAAAAVIAGYGCLAFGHSAAYRDGPSFWDNAVRRSPHSNCAHSGLGQRLAEAGLNQRAGAEFDTALQLDPRDAISRGELGILYLKSGAYAQAEQQLQASLALDPSSAVMRSNLGFLYLQQGRLGEAGQELDRAMALDPAIADLRYNRGCLDLKLGRAAQAEQELRAAVRLSPAHAAAHHQLGYLFLAQGRLDQALSEFRTARDLGLELPELHYNMGVVLSQQGDLAAAVGEFRTALQLRPGYLNAERGLGIVHLLQGDRRAAAAELSAVLQAHPADTVARYYLGRLRVPNAAPSGGR
ncbi:MAG TPA: tetratricopeptide repeat protein, partial [Candidatus Edwardsbacteria bacterium]|nr:tetratricopeptide repeat protein [Candidatus Edwardsbacteria bacterium]